MQKAKTVLAEIVYEDNHLIAVNKPCGVPAQGDSSEDKPLVDFVKDFIKTEYNKPGEVYLGLIHRIDRPVSGLVLFAKTSKALSRMNELFRKQEVKKTYWALSRDRFPNEQGRLEHWILRNQEKNISKAVRKEVKYSKNAILEYQLLANIGNKNLWEIDLQTGRHHQIRAQFGKEGCSIIGDVKYGYKRGNKDRSICLHSKSLEFIHPVKKETVHIEADIPKTDFWQDFKGM